MHDPRNRARCSTRRAICLHLLLPRFFAACGILATQVTAAYAQSTAAGPAAGGDKSYGIPWLIIVVVAALGLFITLRPAGRSAEIRRDARADL